MARALLNNPPIIFADEPTGNLDPESAEVIVNLLYKLCESGKSVLMVTHNHGFFRKYAGRIYTFGNQTVTEQGDNKIAIAIDDLDDMETPAVEAFEAEIDSNVQTQNFASQSEEQQSAPSTDPSTDLSADAQGAAQDATQGTQGEETQSEYPEINSDNVQTQNFAYQSENQSENIE